MARSYKVDPKVEKNVDCILCVYDAKEFRCEFHGSVEEYALMWLHLTNNVREYSNVFFHHANNYKNMVWISCLPCYENDVKEYLEGIGLEIESVEDIDVALPVMMTDRPIRCYETDQHVQFLEAEYDWE